MSFVASRGGHAPGHLRAAFLELVEDEGEGEVDWYSPERQACWDALKTDERLRWLCGQLWNCSDILPGGTYRWLDLQGSRQTFAAAARKLRADLV